MLLLKQHAHIVGQCLRTNCKVLLLVLIVVCVFGDFGQRVRAADGFVFACADVRLHATVGISPLDLRVTFRLVAQRRILCFLESR